MTQSRLTLLDIAVMNNRTLEGVIEEATKAHPEITMGGARTISGLNYRTLVRTANPTVAFRNANEGTATTKGSYENRLVETFILNPQWEVDKAIADRSEDGPRAAIALEAQAILEAAMQKLCSCFYYGTRAGDTTNKYGGDAKAFPGLLDAYDSTNMVVDAGGTTGDTGSSVWAIKFGPLDVQWVWGNGGTLDVGEVTEARILDDDSNPFTVYRQELMAYPGLQVGSQRSIARIKKITADSTKTLTDDMIADLLGKFQVGVRPDVLLMTRRSLSQLQNSRTATNATGAPAPFPSEAFGVPISLTDAIADTEALTL